MTLFWNTWNPLIYAIAGPPRHDGWFPTENDKLALKYTSSPSLCILLSPETSLTFLFLSWLGSSGASSPMSRGLRYNCTMSGSGCMALKTSCESERAVRGLKKTCLQQSYLPFLIPFCTNLRNQHRLCYRAFTSNSRLTFQVHCSELPLKFLYGSLTMAIHPLSAWLTRQVLGGKLIPKHWKRSLFILLSTRSSWLWDYGPCEFSESNLRLGVEVAHIIWGMQQPRLPMQITSIRVSLLIVGQRPGDRGSCIKLFPRKDELKLMTMTNV